jgi:hypothetical protein
MDFQFDPQTYLMQMEGRIIEEVRANKKEFRNALEEQDARLDKLESWRNYLAGAWAVVAAFGAYKLKS